MSPNSSTAWPPRTLFFVLLAFTCCTMVPIGAWTGLQLGLLDVPGVRLAGTPVSGRYQLVPTLRRRAALWRSRSLTIHVGYHVFRPLPLELGWDLDEAAAQAAVLALGHSPNPLLALTDLWQGLFGPGHELAWRPQQTDREALTAYVEYMRSQVERPPVAGTYGPDDEPIAGMAGEALNTTATQRALTQALLQGASEVSITPLVTPPPPGYRRLDPQALSTDILMRTQETSFKAGTGRAHNIDLAAQAIDGTVLLPGQRFSFNEVVGPRRRNRGFAPAGELLNGELVQGVGGGICQVAGTLHAAAFFAGLIVEEYHAHSRLSRLAYLPPGLDAMVAWPDNVHEVAETLDMRLRNPYPFPLQIRATTAPTATPRTHRLRVELFGAASPFHVEFDFDELERTPTRVVQRADPTLARGTTQIEQRGMDGLVIARHRTVYTPYGRMQETTRVSYPPVSRILRVGTAPSPHTPPALGR